MSTLKIDDDSIDLLDAAFAPIAAFSFLGVRKLQIELGESAPGRWTERDDYRAFLKLVGAGKLQTRPLISEIVSPQEGPAVFARLAEADSVPLGIVFDWSRIR